MPQADDLSFEVSYDRHTPGIVKLTIDQEEEWRMSPAQANDLAARLQATAAATAKHKAELDERHQQRK